MVEYFFTYFVTPYIILCLKNGQARELGEARTYSELPCLVIGLTIYNIYRYGGGNIKIFQKLICLWEIAAGYLRNDE